MRGLSPHGRGKLLLAVQGDVQAGSIPARAGETLAVLGQTMQVGVYPRTGGGNFDSAEVLAHVTGLSPHGRGKPLNSTTNPIYGRSIPARAGETCN